MVLPLNLAMTAAEMSGIDRLPENPAWMACHFSPWSQGIANIPRRLPAGAMLILSDRFPCQGHSPDLAAQQLAEAVTQLGCESLLLDFQRPPEAESEAMVRFLLEDLPCPAAVSDLYAKDLDCPVFLSPGPLHVPLQEHLLPWRDREIWLEAALCQEDILVTETGTAFAPRLLPEQLEGGFFDTELCCNYKTEMSADQIRFILFDTPDTLKEKTKKAQALGVTRAVGLYQQLKALS